MKKEDLKFNYNNMMADVVGNYGITQKDVEAYCDLSKEAYNNFEINKGQGMIEWTNLPYIQESEILDIENFSHEVRNNFDYFVVFGMGGSALGASVIFDSLCHLNHNLLSREKRNAPIFFVEDNIDPERLNALLDVIDIDKTMFNIVTKSGKTTETLTQFLIVYNLLKEKLGQEKANKHFVFTTDRTKGDLIEFTKNNDIKCFYIPEGVGGRFSVLSPVGLLPACVLGVDIRELLYGARSMQEKCASYDNNPALCKAVLEYIAYQNGVHINVMMPYSQNLNAFSSWYAQLLAESLGKKFDIQGNIVNVGLTPVKALGITDQHSQQQLYVEGPFDKVITFISVEEKNSDISTKSENYNIEDFDYICNLKLSKLMEIENIATRYAITKNGKINNSIILPKVDAYYLGELFTLCMYEIAYLGYMLNINAFNQPGVEDGKIATFAMLNKKGFEDKLNCLKSLNQFDKYII